MEHSIAYNKMITEIHQIVSASNPGKRYRTICLDLFYDDEKQNDSIHLSEKQVTILKNYGIINNNIKNCNQTPQFFKLFSKYDLTPIVQTLIAIIALISSYFPNPEQQKQTELSEQEVIELRETNRELEEIIKLIQTATYDEAIEAPVKSNGLSPKTKD